MTDIIKPPHAVSIWATKEILYVELPSADNGLTPSHTIKLPLNVFGLTQVVNILHSRSSTSRLGEKGDPTQFQAEKEIKEMQRAAAGYKGPVKKDVTVPLTETLRTSVKDVIRRFINV
jgi:hypothetical protein